MTSPLVGGAALLGVGRASPAPWQASTGPQVDDSSYIAATGTLSAVAPDQRLPGPPLRGPPLRGPPLRGPLLDGTAFDSAAWAGNILVVNLGRSLVPTVSR